MQGLLARSVVAVVIIVVAAWSASWRLESASAQAPTPTATPVPGSPTILVQAEDDKIVAGDPARITLIAFDNEAVDWIRWQARFADSDNDNNAADNEDNGEADNDEASNENTTDDDLLAAVDPDDNTNSATVDPDDNTNSATNDASAIDNDNIDPNADPGLAAVHEFECDEQTACANVWTIMTSKPGRYEIIGEVRDTTGLRGTSRTEIEVRERR